MKKMHTITGYKEKNRQVMWTRLVSSICSTTASLQHHSTCSPSHCFSYSFSCGSPSHPHTAAAAPSTLQSRLLSVTVNDVEGGVQEAASW